MERQYREIKRINYTMVREWFCGKLDLITDGKYQYCDKQPKELQRRAAAMMRTHEATKKSTRCDVGWFGWNGEGKVKFVRNEIETHMEEILGKSCWMGRTFFQSTRFTKSLHWRCTLLRTNSQCISLSRELSRSANQKIDNIRTRIDNIHTLLLLFKLQEILVRVQRRQYVRDQFHLPWIIIRRRQGINWTIIRRGHKDHWIHMMFRGTVRDEQIFVG